MKKLFWTCICLCYVVVAQGQVVDISKKPLKELLHKIESHHGVKFSFAEKLIEKKACPAFDCRKPVSEFVDLLEGAVGLYVNKINDRYYTIVDRSRKRIEVNGVVRDHLFNAPMEGTTVQSQEQPNRGVVTHKDGRFNFSRISLSDTLMVSFSGYKPLRIAAAKFYKQPTVSIVLFEQSNLLEEVVVKNYLSTQSLKTSDGAIVMRPNSQGVLPASLDGDVLQSTQQIPGVQSPVESASGIHVRGGTPDQNLILFDGIKLYNTAHFFGAISAFNPAVIDRVIVYKNASNVAYGNHIAGVVDMSTSNVVPAAIGGSVGMSMTAADATLRVPIGKKVGLQMAFRRSLADFVETPTMNNIATKVFQNTSIAKGKKLAEEPYVTSEDDFDFIDATVKLNYQPNERNHLSFQQIFIQNNLTYTLENSNLADVKSDELNVKNLGLGAQWNSDWGNGWSHHLNAYLSSYLLKYDGNKQRENLVYDFTKKDNTVEEVSAELMFRKIWNDHNSFRFGYQYSYDDIYFSLRKKNSVVFAQNNTESRQYAAVHSAIGEYRWKFGKKTSVHAGLRTSYIPRFDKWLIEPRLYTQVALHKNFWLHASAELKQQYTSKIVEFFTADFGLENKLWALSDMNQIPILQSRQYTLGATLNYQGWYLDVGTYYKTISGLTSLTSGFNNYSRGIFNGSAVSKGLDVMLKKQWSKKLSTRATYAFGNTALTFDGFNNNEVFNGSFNISNALYIAQHFTSDHWDVALGWNFRSGLPFSSLIELNPNNGVVLNQYNNANLPDYHRLDISATYKFHLSKKHKISSKVGLSFLNVYNRKNILKRTFDVAYDNSYQATLQTLDTYSLSFTPNVIWRIEF
ncbi:putative outer membrane protein probably involved in nutrient binding [Tenacibaculum litopenaei]|uniref:TonB-dependent receptor n=1 Tax=Tenacibaculum litopenaei TaxID=396016 RepID=UPI003893B131